ncbi:LOB domain-containing protein 39-like [Neltuma alba]|uniref:LOB domain-containing protein 39-like n=1 Tax=Neltuma alba TaxID=207710 RepID=UPI0010A52A26|nr:LOB domain-containing protein 39-like [Prosopis alba]XP_028795756.1 LOB domain-containing protein 39-like [Prosopis alba]XP_028798001.1 LOB domain-containing protein 39-like [Prosopis alba]
MSCSGCRVLRKRCSDECMLRHCFQGIQGPQAQAHATVFLAKFFGRARLMSFVSAVSSSQRPHLFQSLLFEALGRTLNPVNGAVGLLWSGNWHLCQLAVETVLRGGPLTPLLPPDFSIFGGCSGGSVVPAEDESFGSAMNSSTDQREHMKGERSSVMLKRKVTSDSNMDDRENFQARGQKMLERAKKQRAGTPSTEEYETTSFGTSSLQGSAERRLLRLFY